MAEYSDDPYPEVGTNLGAIIIPWLITLGLLYFDFFGGYSTNPIVIFIIPIMFALILAPKESVENFLDTIGIYFGTLREKLTLAIGSLAGAGLGWGMYQLITLRLAVIPLWFMPLSQTGGATPANILIIYAVVSLGEEFAGFYNSKIAANWFSNRGWIGNKFGDIVAGSVVARLFWSSLHVFSYGFFISGFATLPMFILAFSIGMVFSVAAISIGEFTERKEPVGPLAIMAHWIFDVLTALHLAFIG